jgi:hypothetical protein
MSAPGFFEYEVCYWDEVDQEQTTRHGVTYAEDLSDAAENLSQFYGIDNITSVQFFPLYPEPVYEFNFEENNFKMIEIHNA